MLSLFTFVAITSQLPLADAGQLLLVTGISFAIITLIASFYRFNKLVNLNDKELDTVQSRNDFFFINVTRYISKINRSSPGFGVITIQFQTTETDLLETQQTLLNISSKLIREDCDKACIFGEDCVGLIIDTEESQVKPAAERIMAELLEKTATIPAVHSLRAGASAFPTHAITSRSLVDAATEAMETASLDNPSSLRMASLPEGAEEETPEEAVKQDETDQLTNRDKNSAIDPLTGVLNPNAIGSYMRKYLSELRVKKNPASVLCASINRIDEIIRLHGDDAADAVIAGVSEIMQKLTRESDLIGRYQREEFIFLAPCSLKQGELIAIRLRDAVQKEVFLFEGKRIKTSISVGISAFPEHGRKLKELFHKAHTALNIIHGWKTSSCLVYDPEKHSKKGHHESLS